MLHFPFVEIVMYFFQELRNIQLCFMCFRTTGGFNSFLCKLHEGSCVFSNPLHLLLAFCFTMSLKEHIIVFTDAYILGIFQVKDHFVEIFATIFVLNIFESEVQFIFLKSNILEKMISPSSTIVKSFE